MRPFNMNINSVTSLSTHRSAIPTKTLMVLWVTALSTKGKLLKPRRLRGFSLHSVALMWVCCGSGRLCERRVRLCPQPPPPTKKRKQERQCTYNVIFRCFRTTVVAVVKHIAYYKFRGCVCSPSYTSCNVHTPHFHMWPVRLHSIFPHYLLNGKIFGKMLLNIKCVLCFSPQILSETFLVLRRI